MKHLRMNNFDILYKDGSSNMAAVVLHGYGASFQDLAPLHSHLDPKGLINWYFVDGPEAIDVGMGMTGKSWFPIDMMALQQALLTNSFEKMFADHEPTELGPIRDLLSELLTEIKTKHSALYLGGFSQGSMLALSVVLKFPELISKMFLLSSTLFNEAGLDSFLDSIKSIPTFQSHGISDPVLPYSMAQRLESKFNKSLNSYEFHPFSGGHEIPLDIIEKLGKFLQG